MFCSVRRDKHDTLAEISRSPLVQVHAHASTHAQQTTSIWASNNICSTAKRLCDGVLLHKRNNKLSKLVPRVLAWPFGADNELATTSAGSLIKAFLNRTAKHSYHNGRTRHLSMS